MSVWRPPEPELALVRYTGRGVGRLWFYFQQKGYYFSAKERVCRVPLDLGQRLVEQSSGLFEFVKNEPRVPASPQRPISIPRGPYPELRAGEIPSPQQTLFSPAETEVVTPAPPGPWELEPEEEDLGETVEHPPLIAAVVALVDESGGFVTGTATELWSELGAIAEELCLDTLDASWPKSGSWLSRRLRQLDLEKSGIQVGFRHDGEQRLVTLARV